MHTRRSVVESDYLWLNLSYFEQWQALRLPGLGAVASVLRR